MTDPNPQVAVVVPTHDRPGRLAALFAALRAHTLSARQFEVIVADDGSGPETATVLAAERDRGVLTLGLIRQDRARGPAGARNLGWREARAPLIAFTDDDCRPHSGWLSAGLLAHRHEPQAIVPGRTDPDPAELVHQTVFSRTISVSSPGPSYETCNIFYPRELLELLGGFDETFGADLVGEDSELAWRAIEGGRAASFAGEAVVFHAVHRLGLFGMIGQAGRWSGTARVVARHPQARAMLSRGAFWNGWHYCVLRSVAALALPTPIRRFLLTRHMLQLADRAREAGAGASAIPLLLLYDVVELGAIARGAVRYRTLIL